MKHMMKHSMISFFFQGLCDFLAQPNTLTHLNLSETECPLDLVTTFVSNVIIFVQYSITESVHYM